MTLTDALSHRYATKAYDPARRLPDDVVAQLMEALRLSPSSVNAQPWHFVIADDAAGKARIGKGVEGAAAYNAPKVADASHVVVICARTDMAEPYLETLLDQEQVDGRFRDADARAGTAKTRGLYVGIHEAAGDIPVWTTHQAYLALGVLLTAAAQLGVDATPMEGFDPAALDAEFGLSAQALRPVVLVSLGYRAEGDFNARLPKSRLPQSAVFTKA